MINKLSLPGKTLLATIVALLLILPLRSQQPTIVYVPVYRGNGQPPIYIPQYRYYNTGPSEPWRGHRLLSFHVGAGLLGTPSFDTLSHSNLSSRHPFAAVLRYAGEKYFARRFFWGWQSEASFNRSSIEYTLDGDQYRTNLNDGTASTGQWVHFSSSLWSLALEERITLGFDISYYFSLNISAGIYYRFYSNGTKEFFFTDKSTGVDSPSEKANVKTSFFNSGMGFSTQIELLYFLTDNIFASCSAKAYFSSGDVLYDTPQNISKYAILLGIGYKSYSNRHHDDE